MSAVTRFHLDAIRTCVLVQGDLVEQALAAAELAIEGGVAQWKTPLEEALERMEQNGRTVSGKCASLLEDRRLSLADIRRVSILLKVSHELREIARLAHDVVVHCPSIDHLRLIRQGPLDTGECLAQVRSLLRQSMEALATLDTEIIASIRRVVGRAPKHHQSVPLVLRQMARQNSGAVPRRLAAVL
jgi:hypothetical protein